MKRGDLAVTGAQRDGFRSPVLFSRNPSNPITSGLVLSDKKGLPWPLKGKAKSFVASYDS